MDNEIWLSFLLDHIGEFEWEEKSEEFEVFLDFIQENKSQCLIVRSERIIHSLSVEGDDLEGQIIWHHERDTLETIEIQSHLLPDQFVAFQYYVSTVAQEIDGVCKETERYISAKDLKNAMGSVKFNSTLQQLFKLRSESR